MSKYKINDGNEAQSFDSVQELCGVLRYSLRKNTDPKIVIPSDDSQGIREILSVYASCGRNVEISKDSSAEAMKYFLKGLDKEFSKLDSQFLVGGLLDKFLDGKSIVLTHKDLVEGHVAIHGSSLIIDNLPIWMPDLSIGFPVPFFTLARIAVKLAKAGIDAYKSRPLIIRLKCEEEDTKLVMDPVPG